MVLMKVEVVLLTFELVVLANKIALVGGVLHGVGRSVHLQQQLPGLHHPQGLHSKVVTVDVECLHNPFTDKIIPGKNCGLFVF